MKLSSYLLFCAALAMGQDKPAIHSTKQEYIGQTSTCEPSAGRQFCSQFELTHKPIYRTVEGWTCSDPSSALLTSVDGTKHWCHSFEGNRLNKQAIETKPVEAQPAQREEDAHGKPANSNTLHKSGNADTSAGDSVRVEKKEVGDHWATDHLSGGQMTFGKLICEWGKACPLHSDHDVIWVDADTGEDGAGHTYAPTSRATTSYLLPELAGDLTERWLHLWDTEPPTKSIMPWVWNGTCTADGLCKLPDPPAKLRTKVKP